MSELFSLCTFTQKERERGERERERERGGDRERERVKNSYITEMVGMWRKGETLGFFSKARPMLELNHSYLLKTMETRIGDRWSGGTTKNSCEKYNFILDRKCPKLADLPKGLIAFRVFSLIFDN